MDLELATQLAAEVRWFRSLDARTFLALPAQEMLWRQPLGAAGLAPAEVMTLLGAATDPEVGQCLLQIRDLPAGKQQGAALLVAFQNLGQLLCPRHARQVPVQRMLRIVTVLQPELAGLGPDLAAVLKMRARLRKRLGPEQSLEEHLIRAFSGVYRKPERPVRTPKVPDAPPPPPEQLASPSGMPVVPWVRLRDVFAAEADPAAYVWDEESLRSLHTAWQLQRRFVLVAGTPGIGKTSFLLRYARAWLRAAGQDPQQQLSILPVSPDWRDPGAFFGWLAPTGRPRFWEGPALPLIRYALQHPDAPCFMILDELDLARPEHFLAPVLSAMESGGPIPLHGAGQSVDGVPPSIFWPSNLFLGATLNEDPQGFPLSDRLLDRAALFRRGTADLRAWAAGRLLAQRPVEAVLLQLLLPLSPLLNALGRPFAYRAADTVAEHCVRAMSLGVDPLKASEEALRAHVLSRLKGPLDREGVLALETWLREQGLLAAAMDVQRLRL